MNGLNYLIVGSYLIAAQSMSVVGGCGPKVSSSGVISLTNSTVWESSIH